MKIAIVVPPEESVPPRTYGGTEMVAYNLVEQLCKLGHDVTLVASGDSAVSAQLVAPFEKSIRQAGPQFAKHRESFHHLYIAKVVDILSRSTFDIVHNHIGWRLLAFSPLIPAPIVTTLHGPLDVEDQRLFYDAFATANYVSISKNQRKPMPHLNYVANVYNGIELERFVIGKAKRTYLVFLGRFSPQKGPTLAVKVAKQTGLPLIMAGKVDPVDTKYFEKHVRPLIDGKQITFIGEVNHPQKVKLLGGAIALLSPLQWEEPFGLVHTEALACGTPVIGMRRGSLPELIQHGKVGFLCRTVVDMVNAVKSVHAIKAVDCREHARVNFSSACMTAGYLRAYQRALQNFKT